MVQDATPTLLSDKPLLIAKREMVTSDAKFSNTRKVVLPSTARVPVPGPLIVTLWVI